MSAYPPPPPPFDRGALKQQIRMGKQQARMNRQAARMQWRSMRRRSIVGPVVLVALGIVFLLAQMGRLSWAEAVAWYGYWWPLVLVGAGVALLAEWAIDRRVQPNGLPLRGRTLGGGVVLLLVLLALAGAGSRAANYAMGWRDRTFGSGFPGFDFALGERHDFDDSISSAIPEGGSLLIRNPHGDVTVTGSSDDGQVHVSVHKEAFARTDEAAETKQSQLQPTFTGEGSSLMLSVATVEGGQADLTVQVPRTTMLTVRADHGDVDIQEIHAPVSVTANSGEVNLSGIDGAVSAHENDENSSFSAHSVTGALSLDGRAGDITVSEVDGPVTMRGDFFGTTHLEQIDGTVSFKTSRTQFEAARIDGEFEVSLDSDLEASQVLGPIRLNTRDRGVTLDRVQGGVQISNRNGAVSVTDAEPLGEIEIDNAHGSVDLGVPGNAGFAVNAETRNGSIENDFGLKAQGTEDRPVLLGTAAGGGPNVKLYTTDGDITLRKVSVAPLPAVPPRITIKPPMAPKAPRLPATAAPKPPAAPSAPAD